MTVPRVVLDTNCLVSALVFSSGRFVGLRHGWQQRRFTPLASRDTVGELIRVLTYPKFKLSPDEQQALLADYLPWVQTVQTSAVPSTVPPVRDAHDAIFLILARAGSANALVTGDADLLALRAQFEVPILTASEFDDWMRQLR